MMQRYANKMVLCNTKNQIFANFFCFFSFPKGELEQIVDNFLRSDG